MNDRRRLWLEYTVVSADQLIVPRGKTPERAEGLWKTTCFELFVQPLDSEAYLEFNFSPSCDWAAYEFSGYRRGKRPLDAHDPEIWYSKPGDWFFLSVEALPELPAGPLRLGLSAVIEEKDGTKSYWALAHSSGAPDFHHRDCFQLELPAATPA